MVKSLMVRDFKFQEILIRQRNAFAKLCYLIGKQRSNNSHRYRGPYEWRRLLSLAIILIDFAAIGFAGTMYPLALIIYAPGIASTLGGATLVVLMARIARPGFFWDWTCLGSLQIWIGIVLMHDPTLSSPFAFMCFSALSIVSSSLMMWIGATIWSSHGRVWIVAAGMTSGCCIAVSIVDYCTASVLAPDVVGIVFVLLIGMSLFGLALSLRRP